MSAVAAFEAATPLVQALREPDYRVAEEAALVWLLQPDGDELEQLSSTLIERDARRLGHLLDLLLGLDHCNDLLSERIYRVVDDLRDRIEIDLDQPAHERWRADRTFDAERLQTRLAVAGSAAGLPQRLNSTQ